MSAGFFFLRYVELILVDWIKKFRASRRFNATRVRAFYANCVAWGRGIFTLSRRILRVTATTFTLCGTR
jgi:hypothetical protein